MAYSVIDEFTISGNNSRIITLDKRHEYDIQKMSVTVGGVDYPFTFINGERFLKIMKPVPDSVSFIGVTVE